MFFFCCAPLCAATFSAGPEQNKKHHPGCFFFCSGPGERQGKEKPRADTGPEQKKNTTQGVFFFAAAPAKGKGRRSPVGRRHGARAKKKKHHPGCFHFFCSGPGERQGKEKPRADTGPEQKKKHHPGCFFLLRPGERQGKEKPRWAPARGQSKKKNTTQGVFFLLRPRGKAGEGEAPLGAGTGPFFFALAPCRRPTGLLLPLPFPGAGAKKKTPWVVFFFLLWPRAGAQRGFSFPCLSPGPQQKKKTPWVIFFFALAPCRHGASPSLPFPGAGAKKTPWVGVFCLLRPRADAHSLTAGLGGDASPSPGWCFLFAAAPPGPGWCFFFAVAPPGRSLTHCGLGRFRQGPGGVFFFLLRPRRVFLDNSKKCLGYYIGSKKTRRGHSKKKTPLPRN